MADLKPLGSEKLSADEKLKRILELTYYNEKKNNSSSNKPELVKESKTGGVYGIVKEKDGYHVKRGLNEQSLDYIGGMFMKNKNRFSSYAEAFKRLEFIKGQEELQEATKYVLKTSKPTEEAPVAEPSLDVPPPPSEPAPEMGDVPPSPEAEGPAPEIGAEPSPAPEVGSEETPETGGESKRSDYMAEVQKYAGKLGQELRDQQEKMESDDIKYVLNMIISAVDLEKLDIEDLEEIGKKFEREEEEGEEGEELPSEEPSSDEEMPEPSAEEPSSENDLGEMSGLSSLEELINTPLETSEVSIDQYDDLSEGGGEDEIKEIDLQQIKDDINQAISEKLSKYFN